MVDLRDPEARAALSTDLADLVGPRAACQGLAKRAHRLGADGMVVPSAAREGGWNLVVFTRGLGAVRSAGSTVTNPAPQWPPD